VRRTWHVRANLLVLGWLAAAAVVAIAHRGVPMAQWLMIHFLMLGGATTAILIWSAHFAETVRRRPLAGGRRLQSVRLGGHTVGAITVIVGLLIETWGVVVVGATLVGGVALWHTATLIHQGLGNKSLLGGTFSWITWYYMASGGALAVGVVGGIILANPDVTGEAHARAYLAHVTLMLLGWVGLAVIGTLVTLWPSMLRAPIDESARAAGRRGVVIASSAIAVAVLGAGTGQRLVFVAGLLIYAHALAITGLPHLRTLVSTASRAAARGFPPRSIAVAWAWLFGTVLWWASNLVTASSWAEAHGRSAGILVPLLVGFAAQILLGALSHLTAVVMGGGPRGSAAARTVLNRAGDARIIAINLSLLTYVWWPVSWVRVGTSLVVLGALIMTFVLVVRAAFIARRYHGDEHKGLPDHVDRAQVVEDAAASVPAPSSSARSRWLAVCIVAAVVIGGVAMDPVAAGFGSGSAGGVTATGDTVEITVEAVGMRFEPALVELQAGDRLVITVINTDSSVHDLVLDTGASSGRLNPGETTQIDVGIVGRDIDGWCSVAGHRQMGMIFDIEVLDPGPTHSAPGDGPPSETTASAAVDMDLMAPPAPGFIPFDATLPPVEDATVHRRTFTVSEFQREVAPGVVQEVWAFNESVPGPVLRGKVGDTFEITLVNEGSMGHSIDPGESLVYTFTANRAGIWMYHCATGPMSLHIANGMFGAVIIDPPNLPAVDREFVVVQSEGYFGAPGEIANGETLMAGEPDTVVFNGYANQYAHAPWKVVVGERIRVWVLAAGPSRSSSFHVVGTQFDTVYSEGNYLLGSSAGPAVDSGAQVLGLHAAQGGFVEFVLPEQGTYPFVTHVMTDMERGAMGLIEATDDAP
jgi:nitrite reductase (NO-forming)